MALRGRPAPGARGRHLVVFGAGFQAEAHLFCMLRPDAEVMADDGAGSPDGDAMSLHITEVTLINRSAAGIAALARKFAVGYGVRWNAGVLLSDAEGVRAAVEAADVICTTTGSRRPLFDGGWLKPGCHVNCVGSYRTDTAEVDFSTVSRCSELLVDSFAAVTTSGDLSSVAPYCEHLACDAEAAGELVCDGNAVRAEHRSPGSFRIKTIGSAIGEGADYRVFRDASRDCTLFKSVGTAVQDIATAAAVLARARALGGVGASVELSAFGRREGPEADDQPAAGRPAADGGRARQPQRGDPSRGGAPAPVLGGEGEGGGAAWASSSGQHADTTAARGVGKRGRDTNERARRSCQRCTRNGGGDPVTCPGRTGRGTCVYFDENNKPRDARAR